MTNFDFLLSDPQFGSFAQTAVLAERVFAIDPGTCALHCRRAMEFAVKWMYSVDEDLVKPYDDRLASLISTEEFRKVVGEDLRRRMNYIRHIGNDTAHSQNQVTRDQAALCLENLYDFMDFVACCYGQSYTPGTFDPALLEARPEPAAPSPAPTPEMDLVALMAENQSLRKELTARRAAQQPSYTPKPLELSEYKTRKLYIDVLLKDAG